MGCASQVINIDHSCRAAVAKLIAHRNVKKVRLPVLLELLHEKRLDNAIKLIKQINEPRDKDLGYQLCSVSLARSGATKVSVRVAFLIEGKTRLQIVTNKFSAIAADSGDIETATWLFE